MFECHILASVHDIEWLDNVTVDKLDGLNVIRKHHATSPKDIDSYLQLSEDDDVIKKDAEPGKKRVSDL